jgi:hypothetical protein
MEKICKIQDMKPEEGLEKKKKEYFKDEICDLLTANKNEIIRDMYRHK